MYNSITYSFIKFIKEKKYMKATFISLIVFTTVQFAQPAFPGAEGGGAVTTGGRGGIVIEVTNLNDSGPGSFREAAGTVGSRTIVFKVGGTITLNTEVTIKSNVTIAGQTAPGDGIMFRANPAMTGPLLFVKNSNNIIMRYLRFRPGSIANRPAGDAIALADNVHNVIIDHCSISWGTDENTQLWTKTTGGYNVTWQWCISSEGLNKDNHSCGLIIGGNTPAVEDKMQNISVHHNYFAHNRNRNPLMKCKKGEIINNLVYNWEWWATGIAGGIIVDIIGNKYVKGHNSSPDRGEICWLESTYDASGVNWGPNGDPSIFFDQNIGPNNSEPDSSDFAWGVMTERTHLWGYPAGGRTSLPTEYRRSEKRKLVYPISIYDVVTLDDSLLKENGVGASMHINFDGEWESMRDTVDRRIINEYRTNTGSIPNYVSDVGGFPSLADGIPYIDNDHDGMADVWEIENGLDPSDDSDRNNKDLSSKGYTNLEVFINGSDIITDIDGEIYLTPEHYALEQNYPNPFNPTTVISFSISVASNTSLEIYNVLGQKVAILVNKELNAGSHKYQFNASNLSSGIYFYKLQSNNFTSIKKMMLIK